MPRFRESLIGCTRPGRNPHRGVGGFPARAGMNEVLPVEVGMPREESCIPGPLDPALCALMLWGPIAWGVSGGAI
jgi:hypothetical protein